MATETSTAWVLHRQPSGDSSIRVTFFTLERGVVQAYYKGGRSPKKQALIQPFSPLWLMLDQRREWYFVRHIETQAEALNFNGTAIFAALYLNELLYYTLSPGEAQPALFAIYALTVKALVTTTNKEAKEVLLRRFEFALLNACGYSLSFTEEAHLAKPICLNQSYQYIPGEGFILAETGIAGNLLLAIAEERWEEQNVLKAAKMIMRKALDHLLGGRVLKSRSLFIGM